MRGVKYPSRGPPYISSLLTVGDLAITSPPPQAQLRLCLPATRSVHLTVPNEYTSHLGVVLRTFIQQESKHIVCACGP